MGRSRNGGQEKAVAVTELKIQMDSVNRFLERWNGDALVGHEHVVAPISLRNLAGVERLDADLRNIPESKPTCGTGKELGADAHCCYLGKRKVREHRISRKANSGSFSRLTAKAESWCRLDPFRRR